MTPEKRYQTVVEMLNTYDIATNSHVAPQIIRNPSAWANAYNLNPFYVNAASLLLEAREAMDARTVSKPSLAAMKRIIKGCPEHLKCIFPVTEWDGSTKYTICNGYLIVRIGEDVPSLPHKEKSPLSDKTVNDFFHDAPTSERLPLPSIAEIKMFISEDKATRGRREKPKPMQVGSMYLDSEALMDILQVLPDATAYYPGDPMKPVYFKADNGDAILLPVNPRTVHN